MAGLQASDGDPQIVYLSAWKHLGFAQNSFRLADGAGDARVSANTATLLVWTRTRTRFRALQEAQNQSAITLGLGRKDRTRVLSRPTRPTASGSECGVSPLDSWWTRPGSNRRPPRCERGNFRSKVRCCNHLTLVESLSVGPPPR